MSPHISANDTLLDDSHAYPRKPADCLFVDPHDRARQAKPSHQSQACQILSMRVTHPSDDCKRNTDSNDIGWDAEQMVDSASIQMPQQPVSCRSGTCWAWETGTWTTSCWMPRAVRSFTSTSMYCLTRAATCECQRLCLSGLHQPCRYILNPIDAPGRAAASAPIALYFFEVLPKD